MLYLTWCAALEGKWTSRDLWLTWLWGTMCKSKQGARKEVYGERGPGEAFFGRTWPAFCLIQVCLSLHTCLNHFPYTSTFTFPWNKCLLHAKSNFPFLGMPRKQERSMPRKISSNTDSTRSHESLWRLSVNCQIHPPCFPPKQALWHSQFPNGKQIGQTKKQYSRHRETKQSLPQVYYFNHCFFSQAWETYHINRSR